MNWEILMGIAFLYQYGFVQIAIKKIGATEGSRTRKLAWQYFFAAVLAIVTAVFAGRLEFGSPVVIVAVIGAANAFGCYCHWRAYDISMSRTAVLSNLDDLIAIGLGYALLGEMGVLTPILTAGIVVSIVSATVFVRIKHANGNGKSGRRLIGWVLGYSLIWGVAMFSMRLFSAHGMNLLTYVATWYGGSWVGAILTRFVIMGKTEAGAPLTHIQKAKVFLLAVAIWTSLMFAYWMRELVPITVVQPVQLVAEMSIPTVIALFFFRETGNLSRGEKYTIVISLLGVALVAIGY